jgi:hypothetical protein
MRGVRTLGAVCAVVVATLLVPSGAAAHLRTGTVAVDYGASVSRPLPAPGAPFSVGVYQSDRSLHVSVRRGHTVVVLGYLGEPFLRIRSDGVAVSTRSPTAAAAGLVPHGRQPASGKGWVLHRGWSSVTWHDGRVQQLRPGRRRDTWRVPVIVDGRRESILGLVWRAPSPALWPWLLAIVLTFRGGGPRVRVVCMALGLASAASAIVVATGFALSVYASPGTWIAGVDEALLAGAGAGLIVWGPHGACPAAGAGAGALGLAVGPSRGAVFLHPIVLSVLPGTMTRALIAVAVAASLGAAAAGSLFYVRSEESAFRALPAH